MARLWTRRGAWVLVLLIIGILLLSLWRGGGYVLVVWLGWQVQTSAVLFMLLLVLLIAALVYLIHSINRWVKRYLERHPRNIQHYQQLLPFEQLGCLWLLNAKSTKQPDIQRIFSHSASLGQLINAHLWRESGQFEQARQALKQGMSLPDLLAIERIELSIAEQHYINALNGLQALAQQPRSAFVQSLGLAWEQHLLCLWTRVAQALPWQVLDSYALAQPEQTPAAESSVPENPILVFTQAQQLIWLQALQAQLDQATPEQQATLLNFYEQQRAQPGFMQDIASAQQWLKLLSLLSDQASPMLGQYRLLLADELLQQQFEPQVLSIWLHEQRSQHNLDDIQAQRRLQSLAERYPGQPGIALAQWHQFMLCGQAAEAEQILQHWQQQPDFAYLRLKQALAEQPALLADLEQVHQRSRVAW